MTTRRQMIATTLFGVTALATGAAARAASQTPVERIARHLRQNLSGTDLAALQAVADARHWTSATMPPLSDIRHEVARDFRQDRTLTLNRVRFSRLEAAWYLRSGAV